MEGPWFKPPTTDFYISFFKSTRLWETFLHLHPTQPHELCILLYLSVLIFISSLYTVWVVHTPEKAIFHLCASQLCFPLFGCTRFSSTASGLTSVASVEECDDCCLHHSDNTYTQTFCSTLTLGIVAILLL